MYQVSDEYLEKMLDQVQTHRLRGSINNNISFTESDVIGVSYSNQCSPKTVTLGSVNIGVLKLTFLRDLLNRGDYYGKFIAISDGLKLEDGSFEDVPLGVFYIAEAVRTQEGMVDITAYDVLSKLDKSLNLDQTSGNVYSFCQYIATQTNTIFGMTSEECALLPNGTEVISPYADSKMTTFRDLLSNLAAFCGCFAFADRDGTWKLKTFGDYPDIQIPKDRRLSGSKYSDFQTYYDTLQYTDIASNQTVIVGDGYGLKINLGDNAFLQLGTSEAKSRRAYNILDQVSRMNYIPFEASGLPALIILDLGDMIALPDDYTSSTSAGAVMSINYTYNKSVKFQCYGENPNLRDAQSKTDKNITGITNSTVKNEVTFYNYSNIEAINIENDHETTLASLAFSASEETTVKILHEFIFDILSDITIGGSYELKYYLDDELVSYAPFERVRGIEQLQSELIESSITRDFFYILKEVVPNVRHTWKVNILAHGFEGLVVDVDHAHVTLEGQRLYGEDYYDGFIEAFDEFAVSAIGALGVIAIGDTPNIILSNAVALDIDENFTILNVSTIEPKTIIEGVGELAPHIFLEGGIYITTEDNTAITTEDGLTIITE